MSPAPKAPTLAASWAALQSRFGRKQRLALMTSAMILLTLFIGIVLIYLPGDENLQQITRDLAQENERTVLLLELQRQQTWLRNIQQKWILEGGARTLASTLSKLSAETGIQIDSVTPQPEVGLEPYTKLQVELVATAPLANLVRFFYRLETHEPMLWVEQLEIGHGINEYPQTPGLAFESSTLSIDSDKQQAKIRIAALSRKQASR